MPLSGKSKLKDLLANPEAVKILQKHLDDFDPDAPELAAGMGMSLKTIAGFPMANISKEAAEGIYADLEAANLE